MIFVEPVDSLFLPHFLMMFILQSFQQHLQFLNWCHVIYSFYDFLVFYASFLRQKKAAYNTASFYSRYSAVQYSALTIWEFQPFTLFSGSGYVMIRQI